MKQYPKEQQFLVQHLRTLSVPEFTQKQQKALHKEILRIRQNAKGTPGLHTLLQLAPFIAIAGLWYALIFILPAHIHNKVFLFSLLFIAHGILGYQWVVYGLHEGAGHGLFLKSKTLRFLAFHSSRIMLADPVYYQKVHHTHHKFIGTDKDEAQTNFVLLKRIFISLLPGAGILFPNDYRIHKGDGFNSSIALSSAIGLIRIYIEYRALTPYLSALSILVILLLLSPWVGLTLDRVRESLEHHLMPQSRLYGTRELGLSPLALLICGGPWGQPCHMSHHLAPDFNWYQQLKLHHYLNSLLDIDQRRFFGFSITIPELIRVEWRKHLFLEKA